MLKLLKKPPSLTLKIFYIVEPDEGKFHAFAPGLRGLHVDGNTKDEAERHLIAGIKVYIDSLVKQGDPLPVGPDLQILHREPEIPEIPVGAFLGSLTVQWPSLNTSGIR